MEAWFSYTFAISLFPQLLVSPAVFSNNTTDCSNTQVGKDGHFDGSLIQK